MINVLDIVYHLDLFVPLFVPQYFKRDMSVPVGVRGDTDGPIIEVTNSVWAHQSGILLLPIPPAERGRFSL